MRPAYAALRRHAVAIGVAGIEQNPPAGISRRSAPFRVKGGDPTPFLRQFPGAVRSLEKLEREARPIGASARKTTFSRLVPPCAYEIPAISGMKASGEIFGPVLQVVRWNGDVDAVMREINALGYGLTLGIQTRIDSRAQRLAKLARVGNVYVNRNMIGAVVGVQPFGGEGLSGTGPKAGGPHYLYRFCAEQTLTINTAAAGGNAELLASAG